MQQFKEGDLYWARAGGHGWWPGQVMDLAHADSKVQRQQKKGTVLLNFFGDNSYGFYVPQLLQPFAEYYAQYVRQTPKSLKGKEGDLGNAGGRQ
eukprot:gene4657-4910_t